MLLDYHMHTYLSDGRDSHEQIVASAAFMGIKEISFTDHISLKPVKWAMPMENIEYMVNRIKAVQADANQGV